MGPDPRIDVLSSKFHNRHDARDQFTCFGNFHGLTAYTRLINWENRALAAATLQLTIVSLPTS